MQVVITYEMYLLQLYYEINHYVHCNAQLTSNSFSNTGHCRLLTGSHNVLAKPFHFTLYSVPLLAVLCTLHIALQIM